MLYLYLYKVSCITLIYILSISEEIWSSIQKSDLLQHQNIIWFITNWKCPDKTTPILSFHNSVEGNWNCLPMQYFILLWSLHDYMISRFTLFIKILVRHHSPIDPCSSFIGYIWVHYLTTHCLRYKLPFTCGHALDFQDV